MTVVHGRNRVKGSTVIAVEDPSAVMTRRLKKLGHSFAYLYMLSPSNPQRCQTGWSLSLTPYSLRQVRKDKLALDIFLEDLVNVHAQVQKSPSALAALFPENSLLGVLLSGGVLDSWLLSLLFRRGRGRALAEVVLRRFFSVLLDGGDVCAQKRRIAPLKELAARSMAALAVLAVALLLLRRRLRARRGWRLAVP